MVSFDVYSLLTSILLKETINIIYKQSELLSLPENELRKLLLLCMKGMHFQFNNQPYKQTNGVAMGSPLGPILADVFTAKKWISKEVYYEIRKISQG